MINTAGGRYEPDKPCIYFIASTQHSMDIGSVAYGNLLVEMMQLKGDGNVAMVDRWLDEGKLVFIDSGVYVLCNVHARKRGISMDEALSLAPDKLDGFEELYERYVRLCKRWEDRCWGYLELDQGGRDNKTRTRQKLEAEGLRPMPVYHPLNDGWDYFDELASQYDRIGVGNVVQANRYARKRILATMLERMQDYPNLWIHLLGLTPNEWLYALPASSADSSSWLATLRWAGYIPKAMGKAFGILPKNYSYKLRSVMDSEEGWWKATIMGAVGANMVQRNWQGHIERMNALGLWTAVD